LLFNILALVLFGMQELKLDQHRMLHDGSLVWKINNQRQIDVHVVLLEDLIVILQREGGKYLLRAESSALASGRSEHRDDKDPLKYNTRDDVNYQKYLRSPIVNLKGLMTRTNAAGMYFSFAPKLCDSFILCCP
jgi:hypothetical protein